MHIGHSHDTSMLTREWKYSEDGGLYNLKDQAEEAKEFFEKWGFVVIADVMNEKENGAVLEALVHDLHEINPSTRHINAASEFSEDDLPSSPNHSFRTTCNIVFGRFASTIRSHESVRKAFSLMHQVPSDRLGCSWDTIFYTSEAANVTDTLATQLHWDHNGYVGGEKHLIADDLCVQGVYSHQQLMQAHLHLRAHLVRTMFGKISRNQTSTPPRFMINLSITYHFLHSPKHGLLHCLNLCESMHPHALYSYGTREPVMAIHHPLSTAPIPPLAGWHLRSVMDPSTNEQLKFKRTRL
jgi:hypothetical protein